MKVIIAGSRKLTRYALVAEAVEASGFDVTEVVSGAAKGVDQLGEEWAKNNNVPVKKFPADWRKYSRAAGIVRNKEMAKYAEALIAIWDGASTGTWRMIDYATVLGLKVYVKTIRL